MLLELSKDEESILELEKNYPYQLRVTDLPNSSAAIFSRFPLVDKGLSSNSIQDAAFLVPEVQVSEKKAFRLVLWHARQPLFPSNFYTNRKDCRRLATLVRNRTEDYLVFGDFNATPHSRCYQWFVDSAVQHVFWGKGLQWTWDARMWFARLLIDHGFYSEGFSLKSAKKLESVASDHYPIFADFEY